MDMQYRKIDKIVNVCGFDPQTGNYSFVNKDKEYLILNNELFQKEEAPLLLMTRGKYLYLWYSWGGKLEVYLDGKLLNSIEKDTYLIDGCTLYVGYSSDFEEQNLINPITGELLRKNSIPYKLYVMNDIIIAYDNFRGEFKRINTKTQTLWQFPLSLLGGMEYEPDKTDRIDKILGIAHGNIWFYTKFYRLVALNVETGKEVYSLDCFDVYLDEKTKNIFAIASNIITIIDTVRLTITERYDFLEADPMGIGTYPYVFSPMLQGDYFTFLGEKEEDFRSNMRRVGIFDYKTRKLVWEYEIISRDEYKETGNHLVTSHPLYMSGNKLYIKDIKDNLHIFEREDI